jgi:hypothetical protein
MHMGMNCSATSTNQVKTGGIHERSQHAGQSTHLGAAGLGGYECYRAATMKRTGMESGPLG